MSINQNSSNISDIDIDINNEEEFDFSFITENAIEKFRRDLGKVNILVAGRTGVGKSTLINAVFHENFAITGVGKPITQEIKEFSKEGYPISIIDTKGLEVEDYKNILNDLENYINNRKNCRNKHDQLHVAWICISEADGRFELAEKKLIELLIKKDIPTVVILTKLLGKSDRTGLQQVIMNECPKACGIIRVQSVPINIIDTYTLQPFNLEKLVELTNNVLDLGMRNAFIASQIVDLNLKKEKAITIVNIYSCNTINEIKTSKELPNICIGMITDVTGVFGLKLNKDNINVIIKSLFIEDGGKKFSFKNFFLNIFSFFFHKKNDKNKISTEEVKQIIKNIGEMYVDVLKESFEERKDEHQQPRPDDIVKLIEKEKKIKKTLN